MAVIETRAKVSIVDGATSGLQNITNANERLTASLNRSGNAAKGFTTNMKSLTLSNGVKSNMDGFSTSIEKTTKSAEGMNKMLNRLVYSMARYTVIYNGIQKLGNIWDTVIGGAYEYGNMIETNRVGMAGILTSMMQINGQQLTWNQSMSMSSKIMTDLQNESLKTSATAGELIDTFRALLGPGLSAGMSIEQIEHFTTVGVNAVKSLGLDGVQLVQELRDLVQGGIRPASSTLATALGISDADIKKAKASSEGLYKFLMDRMKGFEYSALATNNTVKGRIDQITEGLQRGIAEGAEPLRKVYSDALKEFGESIVQVNKQTKEWKVNPAFIQSVNGLSETAINIGKQVKEIGEVAMPFVGAIGNTALTLLGQASNHLGMIAAIWAGFKISKYLKDFMQLLVVSREERDLQTGIGRTIQGINDKINHRVEKQKEALKKEKEEQEWLEEENQLIDNAVLSYEKMVSGISKSASETKTLNDLVESNEASVTRLAERWEAMGLKAGTAATYQNMAIKALNGGAGEKTVMKIVEAGERAALMAKTQSDSLKAQEERQKQVIEFYEKQKTLINQIIQAEHNRKIQTVNTGESGLLAITNMAEKMRDPRTKAEKAQARIDKYVSIPLTEGRGKDQNGKTIYKWQIESVKQLRAELEKLNLEEEVVQVTAEKFMDSLKVGMKQSVKPVFDQAIESAKLWNEVLVTNRQHIKQLTSAEIEYMKYQTDANNDNALGQKERMAETLTVLTDRFKNAGMAAEEAKLKAYEFVAQIIQGLKTIDQTSFMSIDAVFKQAGVSAEQYAQDLVKAREQTVALEKANADAALEFNALSNAFKIGGEEAYQATKKLIEESKELQAALNDRGAAEQANAVYKEMANYLKQVADAKDAATLATREGMEATKQATEAMKEHNKALETGKTKAEIAGARLSNLAGFVSMAAMNFSILTDIVVANSESEDEFAKSAAEAAMQISMVAMAVDGLIGLLPALVKGLKSAVAWFKSFTLAKATAALPAASLAAMGIGAAGTAVLYGAVDKYEQYSKGQLTLENSFSDAELGGADVSAYKNLKIGGNAQNTDAINFAEMAVQEGNLAQQRSQIAMNAADSVMKQAGLNDLMKKPDGVSGASGSKGGKEELPEIAYTPAMAAAVRVLQATGNVYAAAAAGGNLIQESGYGTENLRADADNGTHKGAVQWGGERLENLLTYSGGDWTDFSKQLDFMIHELTEDAVYKSVGDSLKGASSLSEANKIWFERYEAAGDDTEGQRYNYAASLLSRLQLIADGKATFGGKKYSAGDAEQQRMRRQKELLDATVESIKDTKKLNETTASITGQQTAYEKTMQEAEDHLKQYKEQIERDKNLGVSETIINGLNKAMDDYRIAMEQKAKEAQQQETMGRYDDAISSIQNRNLGYGEADAQRDELNSKLTEYRNYLEECLNDTALSYDQRIALENKLTSTIKQINDQSCYDYKEGWKQSITELSNTQINWKDTFTSLFGDIESSLADCITSTGNFVTRMKSFFSNFASSVVKSIAQVISKMLVMKMITGLFGNIGGGSDDIDNRWLENFYHSRYGHFADYLHYATGGDATKGTWAMVGENGPEMLHFGQDARVYNAHDTKGMFANSGGNANVQIIVNNNTGTQMEARHNASQDSTGKVLHQIILSTVGEALTTNEYGLRDAIAGVG